MLILLEGEYSVPDVTSKYHRKPGTPSKEEPFTKQTKEKHSVSVLHKYKPTASTLPLNASIR